MKKVIRASDEAKVIKRHKIEAATIPGRSLYWTFGDKPYNDGICDWLSSSVIMAAKTVELEPFSERDVLRVNIVPDNEALNGHLAIIIERAVPKEGGGYQYTGVPISTANRKGDGSYVDYDGCIVVKDFNKYLPGTTMKSSRDVYLQYGNLIEFDSSGFSETGVRKGKLDTDLFSYLSKLVRQEVADVPQLYSE